MQLLSTVQPLSETHCVSSFQDLSLIKIMLTSTGHTDIDAYQQIWFCRHGRCQLCGRVKLSAPCDLAFARSIWPKDSRATYGPSPSVHRKRLHRSTLHRFKGWV